ncbi:MULTISPECIES: hypothetical protein [Sporosarcina]|uniref:Holin-X, holin superfamily III n=1 Tax=Sporosarcina contaminans TaxID=633403 RepID=A0ABW3TSV1_9BACL
MKVKDIKDNIFNESDENLIKFIRKEFIEVRSKNPHKYMNNLDSLRKIDTVTRTTAIARMKVLQEVNDMSKSVAMLTAFVVAISAAYFLLVENMLGQGLAASLIYFVLLCALFIMISMKIGSNIGKRGTAVYFQELLEKIV